MNCDLGQMKDTLGSIESEETVEEHPLETILDEDTPWKALDGKIIGTANGKFMMLMK